MESMHQMYEYYVRSSLFETFGDQELALLNSEQRLKKYLGRDVNESEMQALQELVVELAERKVASNSPKSYVLSASYPLILTHETSVDLTR